MRRLLTAVGAWGLAVGFASAADAPAPTTSPAAIHALVDQLGADRFADREAAAAALEKIGPAAGDALRAAARGDSPEVRERAVLLLTKLKRAEESGLRLAPKRIRLDYTNIPLGTAVNDLKARTGLNLTLDPNRVDNPLRRVTCVTAELPPWEALEAFCSAAGLREVFRHELDLPKPPGPRRGYTPPPQIPNADAVPVVLVDGKPERLAADRSTAVRVLALPPTFPGHRVTLGGTELTLCIDVTPAPGVGWQEIAGVRVSRVIDDSGRPGGAAPDKDLLPTPDPNGNVVFARPGLAMRFDQNGNPIPPESVTNPRVVNLPIRLGTASARSLRRLEGAVYGEIQVPNQHLITVTDPKRHTNAGFPGPGEMRFTVLEVKEAAGPGALGSVRVQLEYPSPWTVRARRWGFNPGWPEPPRNPTMGNSVLGFDAAGKPFPWASSGYTDQSDDGMTMVQVMQFTFRREAGLPAKLVVVGPRLVLVEVPFVLENVPLP